MRTPKHPSAYADVAPILEAALAAGGGAYQPVGTNGRPGKAAATQWRHRVYAYRQALRNQSNPLLGPITTPYDHIFLQISPTDPTVVLINPVRPAGRLLDLAGHPLEIGPLTPEDDPLIEEARKRAQDLGLASD